MRPAGSIFAPSEPFDCRIETALHGLDRFGMVALIYDFAPVPFSPEGEIIAPSVFGARNMPTSMPDLWYGGLYRRDPVQRIALRSVAPLFWSYDQSEASDLHGNSDAAVSEFLLDHHRGRGVTVPIHTPYKGVATVTGVWDTHAARPPRPDQESLARFMFMAHELHRDLLATFDTQDLASKAVRLTPRERECIVLCAQGLSDKQVAAQLERSVSTVVMHMQSAFRKLGARNRAQAIARAAHYRLLD